MEVKVRVEPPSERVSTSPRHVSFQEFTPCRETFSPTMKRRPGPPLPRALIETQLPVHTFEASLQQKWPLLV